MTDRNILALFTSKSLKTILEEEIGSEAWELDRNHARRCRYVVLCYNAHGEFTDSNIEHQAAFLIGRIADVVPATHTTKEGRWKITMSEYALPSPPIERAWKGWRNPVKYTSFEELGIDFDSLEFQPMPEGVAVEEPKHTGKTAPGMTIAEAKKALAATFGVSPDSIQITITG